MNHTVARFSRSADFLRNMPSPDASSAPAKGLHFQPESEVSHSSCSSGCSGHGSPTSLASYEGMFQRSISNHSLQTSGLHHPISASFAHLLEESPVRKVYSAGDLQRMNIMQNSGQSLSESALRSESSIIIEGMSRAYPYSPEEKKVRIERYRIKRHKRNFKKKIKYECRKTLAENRPRIRGRFAKSEESDDKKSHMIENESGEEEDENWARFFENLVAANLVHEP